MRARIKGLSQVIGRTLEGQRKDNGRTGTVYERNTDYTQMGLRRDTDMRAGREMSLPKKAENGAKMGKKRVKKAENAFFLYFFAKKFAYVKKKQYLCTRFRFRERNDPSYTKKRLRK